MEQQIWSLRLARQLTLRPRVAAQFQAGSIAARRATLYMPVHPPVEPGDQVLAPRVPRTHRGRLRTLGRDIRQERV